MVIPLSLVELILEMLQDSVTVGHMGARRTLACARLRFYWYKQRESVELWCHRCAKCAVRKLGSARKHRSALKKHITGELFARVGIDIARPYNIISKGNHYIMVVSDYFTQWVEAYSLKDQEAKMVVEVFVKECVSRKKRVLMIIHSDQRRNFKSKCSIRCASYTELRRRELRFNRTLNQM